MLPPESPRPSVVREADLFSLSLHENTSKIKYEEVQIKKRLEKKKIRRRDFWQFKKKKCQ